MNGIHNAISENAPRQISIEMLEEVYVSKVEEVDASITCARSMLADTASDIDDNKRLLEDEVNGKQCVAVMLAYLKSLSIRVDALYVLADALENAAKKLDCAWKELHALYPPRAE